MKKYNSVVLLRFAFGLGLILLLLSGCEQSASDQTIKELKNVLKTIQKYEYGNSRSWLQHYHELMSKVYNDPAIQDEAEKMMVRVLESNASLESKLLICKNLGAMATDV